jgi:hypothetical protein
MLSLGLNFLRKQCKTDSVKKIVQILLPFHTRKSMYHIFITNPKLVPQTYCKHTIEKYMATNDLHLFHFRRLLLIAQSLNSTSDSAIMAMPAINEYVTTLSSGSYLCAVGISSFNDIITIIPLTNPKSIAYT